MDLLSIQKAYEREPRTKDAIYASDFGKAGFDVYHSLKNTPKTNPPSFESIMIMEAGKQIEESFVKHMQDAGEFMTLEKCSDAGFPIKGDQVRVESEEFGFPLHGYVDAITKDGYPVEIKSYYGPYYQQELDRGLVKESYTMQLANYMRYFRANKGYMVSIERGRGAIHIHTAFSMGLGVYTCGETRVNIEREANRLLGVYKTALSGAKMLPDYEYHPKVTLELLDGFSEANIKKAIKGEKMLSGHPYAIQYSDYKDLWLQHEANMKGVSVADLMEYTRAEKRIMEAHIGSYYNEATNRFRKIK